jgi:hypothetical protein
MQRCLKLADLPRKREIPLFLEIELQKLLKEKPFSSDKQSNDRKEDN